MAPLSICSASLDQQPELPLFAWLREDKASPPIIVDDAKICRAFTPLSLTAQPHLRETYAARKARLARMSAGRPIILKSENIPQPIVLSPGQRLVARAREDALRACGAAAEPNRVTEVLISLLVFRLGMRRDTVARELGETRQSVDHACAICSAWLVRTCATMIGDVLACAIAIAEGAFREVAANKGGVGECLLSDVRAAILNFYSISAEAFGGPSPQRDLALARRAYAAIARKVTRASLARIGCSINRDHSTLVAHVRCAEDLFFAHYGKPLDGADYSDLASLMSDLDVALRSEARGLSRAAASNGDRSNQKEAHAEEAAFA